MRCQRAVASRKCKGGGNVIKSFGSFFYIDLYKIHNRKKDKDNDILIGYLKEDLYDILKL